MEDREIVALYLARDEAAILCTAEKYGARLRRLSAGITGDDRTAEECENDTYQEAWDTIPPQEPRDYLYAYLARIIRHRSLNRCRDDARLKRRAALCELSAEMEECLPAPDDAACRIDALALREAVNGFLGTLGEEKRAIFLRRYWYLDSIAAIAERFSSTEGKIKTELFRLRKRFRDYLEREGYDL